MASRPFRFGFTPIVLSTAGSAKLRPGVSSSTLSRFSRIFVSIISSRSRFLLFASVVVVVVVLVVVVAVFVVVDAVLVVVDAVFVAPSSVVV